MDDYDPLWVIERESGTYLFGLETGRAEGLETISEVILALLEARGIEVDADAHAKISSCDSLPTLQRWAQAAREVGDAAALFDWQPPASPSPAPS